jgi:CRISPR-associated protein (TIGR03986 family)
MNNQRQHARAPYNFVPLPERAVDVREQPGIVSLDDALPSHNIFRSDRRHGYFDITLTTESPLYIRGMLTREEAENKEAYRNKPDFFHPGDSNSPVIPGSSLRGMIRSLLEIVTWSKLTRVTTRQLFYRTVDDSVLGKEYSSRMTDKIESGFLQQDGSIVKAPMLRVRRERLGVDTSKTGEELKQELRKLYEGSGPNMTPRWSGSEWRQYMSVWVQREPDSKFVDQIRSSDPNQQGWEPGILVITGNMAKKKREFVFLLPSENAERIEVPEKMLERFHDDDQITQWQEKAFPTDKPRPDSRKRKGMLIAQPRSYENPVFFLRENNALVFFGRAGMFRLPYRNSPPSLIPDALRNSDMVDFTEAMFGYVRPEKRGQGKQGDKERAYAGRVSVSDARMVTQTDDPYDVDAGGTTPPILGSPKPTAFQHYLVQPQTDDPKKFVHYDSKGAKIRGHKLYWRQRINTVPTDPNASRDSKQHTRMRPIKRGIQFKFRVDFENLTDIELGALAWVLALGSANHHPNARHMLGMGKPFGMGVVKLDATLALRNRERRYVSLFSDTGWSSGDAPVTIDEFIPQFVEFISSTVREGYPSRMQELLTMLEGREPNPLFTYMQIADNEYKGRPVLPYPTEVVPSPEMLAQQEQEHLRQEEEQRRLQEAQRLKADKVARKDMIGDEIKGKVFDVTSKGDIWFAFRWSDGEEYEGVIPHDKVIKKRGENDKIKARIIEQQVTRNGRIEVICEQIVESK